MPYTYSLPTSAAFTGKGLFGYSFGPLKQNLDIYFIQCETGHDTFMVSRKITRTYYILSGSGYFTIDDKRYPVEPGILVEVPPKVEYSYSGKMTLLGISIPGWFVGNDRHTKTNPDVFGSDSPFVPGDRSWWKRLVRVRIFGKSPLNAYLRINQWLWNKAPARESAAKLSMQQKICFFGHFGAANFGNDITLQTMLHHLRLRFPDAKVVCICSEPEVVGATQKIETVPISRRFVKPWRFRTRLARLLRRVFVGVPSELCRCFDAFKALKGMDMLIIPGTGLLTDAYGLSGWGPYNLFKWSLIAKLRGCHVLFVSVGAGPIYSTLGRCLVKTVLSLADFRSYRDNASLAYVQSIGFSTNGDRVYPDLVFSLPESSIPNDNRKRAGRPVVGLGVMAYAGKYSVESPSNVTYQEYLQNLVAFAGWLLKNDYAISLLIGDLGDLSVSKEFKSLLNASFGVYDEDRIIDQPALSVEQLLPQIAATDIVVATRFHNVLLALVLNKPVVAISFHHKCSSLMSEMGLAEYCHDINHMNAGRLIKQFQGVEKNAEELKPVIRQRVEQSRKALDEQYKVIFKCI